MKRFRLELAEAVRDLLIRLPSSLKRKIKASLRSISENPYQAKALKDELAGLRSFRVAQSRMILQIKASTVEIVAFGPRKDIYHRIATKLRSTLQSSPTKLDS